MDKVERSQLSALQEQVATLLDLYRTLKHSPMPRPNSVIFDSVERVIKISHCLSQSAVFSAALHDSSALGAAKRTSLQDRMAKLGQSTRQVPNLYWQHDEFEWKLFNYMCRMRSVCRQILAQLLLLSRLSKN